jgi:hypothetical protein
LHDMLLFTQVGHCYFKFHWLNSGFANMANLVLGKTSKVLHSCRH